MDCRYNNATNVLKEPNQENHLAKAKRIALECPILIILISIRVLHNNIKSGAINYIQVIENGGAAIAAIKSRVIQLFRNSFL